MKFLNTKLSYKTRNIITLCVLLLLVVTTGAYYCFGYYAKKEKALDRQLADVQKKVTELEFVGVQLEEAEKKMEDEQIKLANIDKQIAAEVTPEKTFQYFNNILNFAEAIDFNMSFSGIENKKKFQQAKYQVKGKGDYHSIFKLISYLEKGPEIYKIEKLRLQGEEDLDMETQKYSVPVSFSLEVLALSTPSHDLPKISRRLADVSVAKTQNVFYPSIKKDVPPNFDELLDIRQAALKALISGKVYVVDAKGKTYVLERGAKVYLGYLLKIDKGRNRVTFRLNKGGISEDFILKLNFGDKDITK